jgi:peptide deformylase
MIITNNEEALRVKCEDVLPEEVAPLIDQLERELEYSGRMGRWGVGLAAPQIGIAKKIAIVRLNESLKVDLVNCHISKKYDPFIFKEEGCLSFPNRIENTDRYQEIVISDNLVRPVGLIATGLFAVVIQHELDHLNGILLPDIAIPKPSKAIGPNEPCYCGQIDKNTGRITKFKKCHGRLK